MTLGGLLAYLSLRPPIVIEKVGEDLHFYPSQFRKTPITKEVASRFVEVFIRRLHENGPTDSVPNQVSQLVTPGFFRKLEASFSENNGTARKTSSFVSALSIKVDEKEVSAEFYKIILIEGVPLVTSKHLLLEIEQGERTSGNPVGLYVNGMIEKAS